MSNTRNHYVLMLRLLAGITQHMREYIFGVLQTFGHLKVGALECTGQRVGAPLTFFIHVGYNSSFTGQNNLSLILEIDLHNLVGQPEHNSMASAHPLLDVDFGGAFHFFFNDSISFAVAF